MTFDEVLAQLRAMPDACFLREGWNAADQWIALQTPDEHSKMTRPYLYIRTVQGDLVPWTASQTDILAHDWTRALV